jgi:hypothetical protein
MLTDPICEIMKEISVRQIDPKKTNKARPPVDLEKSREPLDHQETRFPVTLLNQDNTCTAPNSVRGLSDEHVDPTCIPLPESRSSSEPVQGSMSQPSPRTFPGDHNSAVATCSTREVESTEVISPPQHSTSKHGDEVSIPGSESCSISRRDVIESNLQSHTKGILGMVQIYISPVHNLAARGPVHGVSVPLTIDESLLAEFHERFPVTSSTADDLTEWLLYQQQDNAAGWKHSLPGSAIFNILQNDTMDFIQTVETFLERIEANFSNETVVQENLSRWRSCLLRIGAELRYLERSFPKLAGFLTSGSGQQCPAAQGQAQDYKIYDIQSHLLPDIVAEISRLEIRIKNSLQDLVSVISLIESRKGIAEAESITKLTELGLSLLLPSMSPKVGC